jgi:hypothetical protein
LRLCVADNSTVTIHIFSDPSVGAQYQTNQAEATLEVNGMTGTSSAHGVVNLAPNQPGVLTLTSILTGNQWELALGTAPLLAASAGGLVLGDGQILNMDLTDPNLLLLWNAFASPPFLNLSIPFSFPSAVSLSAQLAVLDSTATSGVRLSAPIRVIVQ